MKREVFWGTFWAYLAATMTFMIIYVMIALGVLAAGAASNVTPATYEDQPVYFVD